MLASDVAIAATPEPGKLILDVDVNLKTADVYEQDGSVKEHVELIEE